MKWLEEWKKRRDKNIWVLHMACEGWKGICRANAMVNACWIPHSILNTNSDVWDSDSVVYVQEIRNQVFEIHSLVVENKRFLLQVECEFFLFQSFVFRWSIEPWFCFPPVTSGVSLTRTNHRTWALPKPSKDLNLLVFVSHPILPYSFAATFCSLLPFFM